MKWIDLAVDIGKAAFELIAAAVKIGGEQEAQTFTRLTEFRDELRDRKGVLDAQIAEIEKQSDARMDALEKAGA